MYQGLTSALESAASWLQFASLALPLSQLAIATWVMFVVSGSFNSKNAFNPHEQ